MSNKNTKKPHFIVIGPGKAATTWLHHVFYCDPQFWYPEEIGEIGFFDRDFDKGFSYYSSLYEGAPDNLVTVDVSPGYHLDRKVPRRIIDVSPGIDRPLRFMIILREPVSRLISDYQMQLRRGFDGPLSEAIDEFPHIVSSGLYWHHLQHWFKYFSDGKFLAVLFDDIQEDKRSFFSKIENFLKLKDKIENPYGEGRVNPGGLIRYPVVERMLQFGGQLARNFGAKELVYRLKATDLVQEIYRWNRGYSKLDKRIDIDTEELRSYFKEDVKRISSWMGSPQLLKKWGYDNA